MEKVFSDLVMPNNTFNRIFLIVVEGTGVEAQSISQNGSQWSKRNDK
jgi:hypothetical protein